MYITELSLLIGCFIGSDDIGCIFKQVRSSSIQEVGRLSEDSISSSPSTLAFSFAFFSMKEEKPIKTESNCHERVGGKVCHA